MPDTKISEQFLTAFAKGCSVDEIPSTISPLNTEDFNDIILSMKFRQPVEVGFLEEVGVDEADGLLNQINKDIQVNVRDRDVILENRNFIAASGNALIITFMGWIYKYPLNEF